MVKDEFAETKPWFLKNEFSFLSFQWCFILSFHFSFNFWNNKNQIQFITWNEKCWLNFFQLSGLSTQSESTFRMLSLIKMKIFQPFDSESTENCFVFFVTFWIHSTLFESTSSTRACLFCHSVDQSVNIVIEKKINQFDNLWTMNFWHQIETVCFETILFYFLFLFLFIFFFFHFFHFWI